MSQSIMASATQGSVRSEIERSDVHPRCSALGGASDDNKTQKRASGMQAEVLIQGRVGLFEWQRIARSGQSRVLGATLIVSCALVTMLMYLSSLSLGLWTSASRGKGDALNASRELALYITVGSLFALACTVRVSTAALYFTRISRRLHERMVAAVLRQPLTWYDTTPLGRVLNRFSQDVSLMDLQLPRLFEFTMQHTSVVAIGVIGAVVLAWPTFVAFLPIAWICWKLQHYYGRVALHLQRIMLSATSPVMSQTSGFLIALDTIRAFQRETWFTEHFHLAMADYIRSYYWIHATDRLAISSLTVICIPLLVLLLGVAVIFLARWDLLSVELGSLALSFSLCLAQRIPFFIFCSSTLEKFFGGAQRVAEYADMPWEGNEVDHASWKNADAASLPDLVGKGTQSTQAVPALKVEDIYFRYQPGLGLVLRGLTLEVWAGEKVAICGRTGSGKSTLFLACFRMVEADSGRILVGGDDARSIPLPILRSRLAIVPQDPLMFSGTVRSNLDVHGHYDESMLWHALKVVQLEEQIRALPLGLEEPVQEKGHNFSCGTVQLLCIARIILGQQHVVFLDECTASVDFDTDAAVQVGIRSAFTDCAVICIAHRLRTILDYDRIVYLEKGRVAETGSARELLTRGGLFADLVDSMGEHGSMDIKRRLATDAEEASGRVYQI
eukprot:TRINITY_DN14306_c1_g3_i2.p1 TRINITY_DN14306_c1_g3~~TRINITY_DN14306_c1_g3_i2.p1  ORF type:complete len:710 (-),score=38.87 TRINITY_DN14306_c1_g3_i2:138-2150(-)